MQLTALCFKLTTAVMMLLSEHEHRAYAASLRIDPNKAQFFEYESVKFHCEGCLHCKVVKFKGKVDKHNGKIQDKSLVIKTLYGGDSGQYWCDGGESSVSITVTDAVLLEIPALPVTEGEAVTLRCRNKTTSSRPAHFYKDGVSIASSPTGSFTIHSVTRLHGGRYKCSFSGAAESAESWLMVTAAVKADPSSTNTLWAIVTVLLVLLLLVVGLLHFTHKTAVCCLSRPGSDSAGGQTAAACVVGDRASASSAVTYAVVTENRKNEAADDSSSLAVYCMLDADHAELGRVVSGVNPPSAEDDFYSTIQ